MKSVFYGRDVSARSGVVCIALALLLIWMQPTQAEDVAPTKPSTDQTTSENADPERQDWRAPLLAELERLANNLAKQQKFNEMLRDRVDILNHRIDKLEDENATLRDQLSGQKPSEGKSGKTASAPTPSNGASEAETKKKDPKLPDEFEQFLDMGEAMLRRFFGVVKEFREEFEDNRA